MSYQEPRRAGAGNSEGHWARRDEVPPEMVAKAADLLSIGDGLGSFLVSRGSGRVERPERSRDLHLAVMKMVGGRRGKEVVRVPLDVPAGVLGGPLCESAAVEGMSALVRRGQVVLPHQALGGTGVVGAGPISQVDELPAHVAEPVIAHRGPRGYPAAPRPVRRERRALSGAVAGAVAAGICFAGGAVLRGGPGASVPAAARLGRSAAQAWLSGQRFSGPTRGDVGALLDRRGPALTGHLEPAGSWSTPGLLSQQFVVSSPAGTFGLSVVVYKGYIVYPPTPSPLPFVEPPGAQVPETGTWVKTDVARSVENWASATFAPTGALRPANLALSGAAQVLDEWRPRSGASLVARVQVPLASTDGFAAYGARQALIAARQAVLAGRLAAEGSAARLRLAEEQAAADDTAAQQKVQVASAGAPVPKAAAAVQGTATSEPGPVTKAEDVFRAAEDHLAAAERQETSAQRQLRLAQARPMSLSGVYDVAFDRHGNIAAWAPAEYGA